MTVEYQAMEMLRQYRELGLTDEQAMTAALMSVSNTIVVVNDLESDNIKSDMHENYVGYANAMGYLFELREEILKA